MLVLLCAPAMAQRPARVSVAQVEEKQLHGGQIFIGTVMPVKRSVVGSAVDGRVIEVPIEEGYRVKKGDVLAQLLTRTIDLEIEAAQATLRLREEEHKELKAGARPEEIDQALARLDGAKALRDYAKARFQRTQKLFQRERLTSKEDFDEAMSVALSAEKAFLAAQKAYELIKLGPRKEQIAQAAARRDAQQAEVERLTDRLSKFTIRAPFDGYVTKKHTEVGAWITSADDVAEVIQLDPVEIEVAVPEQYITYLQVDPKNENVPVQLDALPEQYLGYIAAIVPQADLRTRSFPVKIRVKNPAGPEGDRSLKAGMLARVTLGVGRPQRGIVVPKDALVLGAEQPQVYLVTSPLAKEKTQNDLNRAIETALEKLNSSEPMTQQAGEKSLKALKLKASTPIPVRLGAAQGSEIQVIGEIAQGRHVVIRGNERLQPNQPLILLPGSTNTPATEKNTTSITDTE